MLLIIPEKERHALKSAILWNKETYTFFNLTDSNPSSGENYYC